MPRRSCPLWRKRGAVGLAAAGFVAGLAAIAVADLTAAAPGGGSAATVPGEAVGQIVGRVIDRTAPVHAVAAQPVRLDIIERGASSERRAVTDAQGRFAFAGLPVGGIRVFLVGTEFGGVLYQSDRVVLTPASPTRSVVLAVYTPTRDRSGVHVVLVFGVVDVARGGLRVSVIQRLQNPTDRTAVTTAQAPLRFPLPPGAEAVTFVGGWRDPRVVDGRIEDVIPIPPGMLQVGYAYGLEARGRTLVVPWSFPDGAGDVEILVADQDVRVAGDGLRPAGRVTKAGRRYQRWSGGPIAPGGRAAVRLSGVPPAQDPWPGLAAAALALVLGGSLALALRRPRSSRA